MERVFCFSGFSGEQQQHGHDHDQNHNHNHNCANHNYSTARALAVNCPDFVTFSLHLQIERYAKSREGNLTPEMNPLERTAAVCPSIL